MHCLAVASDGTVEVGVKVVQDPRLHSLLLIVVEGVPADGHAHHVDCRGAAHRGPAAVDARHRLGKRSLRVGFLKG